MPQFSAVAECARVARERVVLLTWDPEADAFWLLRDYLPTITEVDRRLFPPLNAELSTNGVTVLEVTSPSITSYEMQTSGVTSVEVLVSGVIKVQLVKESGLLVELIGDP
jgi:hypothetical protein